MRPSRRVAPVALALAAVLAFAAGDARADGGMCRDGVLIEIGNSMETVWDKCGPPQTRNVYTEQDESWIYVPGPGYMPRMLIFHLRVLQRIRILRG